MADDKRKRGSPDNKRVNKSEPYEVAYARKKAKKAATKSAGRSTSSRAGAARKTAAKKASSSSRGAAPRRSAAPAKKTAARGTGSTPARKAAPRRSPAAKTSRAVPSPSRRAPAKSGGEKTAANTAPAKSRPADAVDLLTDDHLLVDAAFKRYEKLADGDGSGEQRQSLAREICTMLKVHAQIEEEIFYPAARAAGIDEDLMDEADVEHASAKDLIAQIESASPDADKYDAKVTVLGEYIAHHVKEEHSEMFAACRRSKMDLVALRGELETRKQALEAADGGGEKPGLIGRLSDTLFSR